jgi:hypothetical protein
MYARPRPHRNQGQVIKIDSPERTVRDSATRPGSGKIAAIAASRGAGP